MSLTNCPECQEPISSEAQNCPHCGFPLQQYTVQKIEKTERAYSVYGWGTFIYFLIMVAGLFMLFEGRLFGIVLLLIGFLLLIARFKLWSHIGKKIK